MSGDGIEGPGIERVLAAVEAKGLTKESRRPGEYRVQCPLSHRHPRGDRNPSLHVWQADAHAGVFCHACQSRTREVIDALGLKMADLQDNAGTRGARRVRPDQPPPGLTLTNVYPYLDYDGWQHSRVRRYVNTPGDKTFRQGTFREQIAPDGTRSWDYTDKAPEPAERVLYNLPEVLVETAQRGEVWLVEGEKDVEALTNIDIVATCVAGGANVANWQPQYTDMLRGASMVRIVADRDAPGYRYASWAYQALTGSGIPCEVVRTPLPQPKADTFDHLAAGLSIAELEIADDGGLAWVAEAEAELAELRLAEEASAAEEFEADAYPDPTVADRAPRRGSTPWCRDEAFTGSGILGRIALGVLAEDSVSEADPVGILATLASACSALIGPGAIAYGAEVVIPTQVWTLLFGESSSGRKGTATDYALAFVRAATQGAEGNRLAEIRRSGLSSGEGLIEDVRDYEEIEPKKKPKPGQPPEPPEIIGTHDKSRLYVETEFRSVLVKGGRDGSSLSTTLRDAFDGTDLRVANRAANRLASTDHHIAVIAHMTPGEFTAKTNDGDLYGGLLNRFLVLYVERRRVSSELNRPPLGRSSQKLVDELRTSLRRAMAVTSANAWREGQNPPKFVTSFNSSAQEEWRKFYGALGARYGTGPIAQMTHRAESHALRLACVFALLDIKVPEDEDPSNTPSYPTSLKMHCLVRSEHMRAAIALVDHSLETARLIFDPLGEPDKPYDRAARAVLAARGMSRTDIQRMFSNNLTKVQLDAIITAFVEDPRFMVEKRPGARGNNKPSQWVVPVLDVF